MHGRPADATGIRSRSTTSSPRRGRFGWRRNTHQSPTDKPLARPDRTLGDDRSYTRRRGRPTRPVRRTAHPVRRPGGAGHGSSSGSAPPLPTVSPHLGATVVVNSATSVARPGRSAAELPDASYVQADVADEPRPPRLIDEVVHRHGRLDILVNNTGPPRSSPTPTCREPPRPTSARRIFSVNVIGTWQVTVAARHHLRAVRARSGDQTSSRRRGERPTGSSIPYACSKAAGSAT